MLAAALGGLVGAMFDSFLGASVQAIYFCPVCEKRPNASRAYLRDTIYHLRGWGWLDNEVVNFMCSLTGRLLRLDCG